MKRPFRLIISHPASMFHSTAMTRALRLLSKRGLFSMREDQSHALADQSNPGCSVVLVETARLDPRYIGRILADRSTPGDSSLTVEIEEAGVLDR